MKLITYLHLGVTQVGALTEDGDEVLPLPYLDMNSLIELSTPARLRSAACAAECGGAVISLDEVELLSPIPHPRQDVICLGINYKAHADEADHYSSAAFGGERPVPIYFSKRVNEAVAPGGIIPQHSGLVQRLDYEAELAVIIGKAARDVKAEDVQKYLFGYTIVNDVSARLLQTAHKQWYFGKSLDGFTPMGPCIVTADEIDFPPALDIKSYVNGQLRQDANTNQLITGIAEIVAELSSGMTLLPGTIIATGTPAGVGMGFDPPQFLRPGDVVECQIEGLGLLRNTVQ